MGDEENNFIEGRTEMGMMLRMNYDTSRIIIVHPQHHTHPGSFFYL